MISESPIDTWRFLMWKYDEEDKQVILDCCNCTLLKTLERRVDKYKKAYKATGDGFREGFLYY